MGTSMEEAFKHFDKDGCGSITSEGFSTGLREMGVFQEFSDEEVEQVQYYTHLFSRHRTTFVMLSRIVKGNQCRKL